MGSLKSLMNMMMMTNDDDNFNDDDELWCTRCMCFLFFIVFERKKVQSNVKGSKKT